MCRSSPACASARWRKTSSIRLTPIPERAVRAPATKRKRGAAQAILSARLLGHVTLETRTNGNIVACFHGHSLDLGKFSAGAAAHAQDLRVGLPLDALASDGAPIAQELH